MSQVQFVAKWQRKIGHSKFYFRVDFYKKKIILGEEQFTAKHLRDWIGKGSQMGDPSEEETKSTASSYMANYLELCAV